MAAILTVLIGSASSVLAQEPTAAAVAEQPVAEKPAAKPRAKHPGKTAAKTPAMTQAMTPAKSAACPPTALGTERTLIVGSKGGLAVGLKTYPQTLDLADHEVVLTFDDGPWPATTPQVLDALARQCVKATFFLIGRNAAAAPWLVRREIAEGHTLGHHTFSHPGATLRGVPDAVARRDIDKGFAADDEAAYGRAAAEPRVPFFRFPGFADTPELVSWLEGRNIAIFGADLWASDWLLMTPQAELHLVLERLEAHKGGILLLHDTRRETARMLPELLVELKKRGFKIVHLVPGTDMAALRKAPEGWTSETEAIIRQVEPKLAEPKLAEPKLAQPKLPQPDLAEPKPALPEPAAPPPAAAHDFTQPDAAAELSHAQVAPAETGK